VSRREEEEMEGLWVSANLKKQGASVFCACVSDREERERKERRRKKRRWCRGRMSTKEKKKKKKKRKKRRGKVKWIRDMWQVVNGWEGFHFI
jgi:NAD(P)H-hydrate repair Nnr-like enzyme with NAD(P)H-hydrate epimerase domain